MTGPVAQTFPIRLSPRLRPLLLAWGVTPASAWVRLDGDRLVARFGFFHAEIPLADIEWWDITGPYRWWRAVGVRHTLGQADISFGGNADGGLRVHLRRRQRIGWVNATDLYVTVADLEGLGAALTARGISGQDRRRR
jgi:hypothetical protein